MTDKSRDLYRGLLIPDGDLYRIWEAETTVDEAGNRAGIPRTSSKTEAVLQASGHQIDTDPYKKFEMISVRGGYPGPGEGGLGWRYNDTENWRGWDVPHTISAWENINFESTTDYNLHSDLLNVTRPDGTDYMLCVYEFVFGSSVRIGIRKRTGDVWGGETVVYLEDDYLTGNFLWPSITVLPTGRVLLFHWVYDHSNNVAQMQMSYSDDEGTTWKTGGSYILKDPIDITNRTCKRQKVAYKDGQTLILAWINDSSLSQKDIIIQYASDDLGATFLKVTEFSGADTSNAGGIPDVTTAGGFFVVTWIKVETLHPVVLRLGSAYQPIVADSPPVPIVVEPWAEYDGGAVDAIVAGDLSIATDEDGVVYLYGTQEIATSPVCVGIRSYDSGLNWDSMGVGGTSIGNYGRWWGADEPATGSASMYPIDYCMEFNRGRAVVSHRYLNNAQQNPFGENSLAFFYLGGYSSVVFPGLQLFKRDTKRAGLSATWVPFGLPDDSGLWSSTSAGAPTEAIVLAGYQLVSPPGSILLNEVEPNEGTGNNDIVFEDGAYGRFSVTINGAPMQGQSNIRIWTTAGAPSSYVEIKIEITDTLISVIDVPTSAVLGTVPNAVGQKNQIFWAVRGVSVADAPSSGECSVWWRAWNTNEDRYWTEVYRGPLTLATGGTTSFISWGDGSAGTDLDSYWHEYNVMYGRQTVLPFYKFTGGQIAQGQLNPKELFPRNFSNVPLFVASDSRVAITDGPTFEGDQWSVNVRHLQATENVLPTVSPSPAKTWRSKTAVAGATIAFQRNVDGEDAWAANDFYAIHFENVNFKRAQLQYRIGGAWVNVVNISFYREFDYQRRGHSIRTVSDDSGSFYAYYNEFAGNKIEFNPDPIIGNAVVATVLRNSEGMAYEGTAAKPATLFLDPDTYTPADVPASGTAHLWFKNMTVLIPNTETPIEGIRLQLCPTGTLPPEGYYEAGNIIPGPVALFGWDYSRERNITKTPNVDLSTLRDGTRHAYKEGETRRRVRFSWAEGVDVSQIRREYTLPASPDYVTARAGGTPVALRNDSLALMWGLLDRIDGPGIPVVYIPLIEYSQIGGATFDPRQNARGSIYGRTVSPVTLEQVVGSEEKTEVYRVNTLTIEEEL
jgi:hypothetical protein